MLGQQTSSVRSNILQELIATVTHAVQLYLTDTEYNDAFALHSRPSSAAAASMASNDLEERFRGIGLADSTAKWVAAYPTLLFIPSHSPLQSCLHQSRPPAYNSPFLTDVLHLAGLLSRTRN